MTQPDIGHNGGPPLEPTPFEAAKITIDDIFMEAKAWLDGSAITNEKEAAAVELLLDMARKGKQEADAARKKENGPFDTGKAEVQTRYNPILKRADLIVDAGRKALTPWKAAVLAERERVAAAARLEADRIAKEAQDAIRASRGDVEAREAAELLLKESKTVERAAKRAEKSTTTDIGMRSTWTPRIIDWSAALDWAFEKSPDAFESMTLDLARSAVRGGARTIPGFAIEQIKVAA